MYTASCRPTRRSAVADIGRWCARSSEATRIGPVTFEDAELAAIRQPTLHVYGIADPVGSADIWKRVAGVLPRGELRLVEGAGHMPWFDDSTRFAEEVGHFLAR